MEKAFDSVEWPFMRQVLSRMGLGLVFLQLIGVLYDRPVARVKIGNLVTDPFDITRGTRQGCPLSPILYALVAEPLACALREYHSHKGIRLPKHNLIVSTYADDTLIYVRDPETNLSSVLREVVRFCALSGLPSIGLNPSLSPSHLPRHHMNRTTHYSGLPTQSDIWVSMSTPIRR